MQCRFVILRIYRCKFVPANHTLQYYAPTLYLTLGIGLSTSKLLTGMINIFQLIGVTITLFYMDTFGRRPLTIAGAAMMGIPHCIMAGIVAAFGKSWPQHQAVAWFGVALLYFYMFSYGKLDFFSFES